MVLRVSVRDDYRDLSSIVLQNRRCTMEHEDTQGLDEIAIREIALEAGVDPRSVRKELSGRHVRGVAGTASVAY